MSRKYENVVRAVMEMPWAILPSHLAVIEEVLSSRLADETLSPDEIRDRLAAAQEQAGERAGGGRAKSGGGYIAVLPIYGSIVPRATLFSEFSGGSSVSSITATFRAALADDEVRAIVLEFDSPGGAVSGVPELAAEIAAARGRKPIVAVANYLAASAAYWLASQADELYVSPSALVGSIGVYATHFEMEEAEAKAGVKTTLVAAGERKIDGNPYEKLSERARATMQARVDGIYADFLQAVASGRGVDVETVKKTYGQGDVLRSEDAVRVGMADGVATLDETLRIVADRLSSPRGRGRGARAATDVQPVMVALEPTPEYATTFTVAESSANSTAALTELNAAIAVGGFLASHSGHVTAGAIAPEEIRSSEDLGGVPAEPSSGDRREQMHDVPNPPKEHPEMEHAAAESGAQPRQNDPARDEMYKAISDLTVAVQEMNAGRVDRETVERMKDELEELRASVDATAPRSGFTPDDVVNRRKLGIAELHGIPAKAAAQMSGIPVDAVAEFQRVSDNLLILAAATKKSPTETSYYADSFLPAIGAMALDTGTVGEGKDFVPTILSGDLIERVELQLRVAALFRAMDMPSNPYEIPGFAVNRVRGGRHAEQTASTGQTAIKKITPGTRKITLTAVKFAAETLVSKETEEDSLIPILDFIRDELTSQLAHDVEDAIINGDTAGTHMDSNVTASDDPRKNWEGLRKLALAAAKTDGGNAVLSSAMLRVNRKKMGKYGVSSDKIAHVLGIGSYVNLLGDANVLTVDKYGPNAVVLAGELARVDGVPLVVSEYVQDNLNATGVFDNTTTNRTIAATVNRDAFLIGNRRGMTVELLKELYSEYDQDALKVSLRKAFQPRFPAASERIVAVTYNLAQ